MDKFNFGDKVRRIGFRDVFVVLGLETGTGRYQIAALNHKTSAKPAELERA
jgi:hypothetical protein